MKIISSPLNLNFKDVSNRGYTLILLLKLDSSIYSENLIIILVDIRPVVPLWGLTKIISGGVSSIGPPDGGLTDAQFHNTNMLIKK